MDYPINFTGFENRRFILRSASYFKGATLWIDGQMVQFGPRRREFLLRNNDQKEVTAKFKGWLDPVPDLEIDGVKVSVVVRLKWYEWVWNSLPLLLIVDGGALGLLFGFFILRTNIMIFRTGKNRVLTYALTGLISVSSFTLYGLFSYWLHSLVKK
jgi:hypothetical protein